MKHVKFILNKISWVFGLYILKNICNTIEEGQKVVAIYFMSCSNNQFCINQYLSEILKTELKQ